MWIIDEIPLILPNICKNRQQQCYCFTFKDTGSLPLVLLESFGWYFLPFFGIWDFLNQKCAWSNKFFNPILFLYVRILDITSAVTIFENSENSKLYFCFLSRLKKIWRSFSWTRSNFRARFGLIFCSYNQKLGLQQEAVFLKSEFLFFYVNYFKSRMTEWLQIQNQIITVLICIKMRPIECILCPRRNTF